MFSFNPRQALKTEPFPPLNKGGDYSLRAAATAEAGAGFSP